jgi:TolA-binding protein
MGLFRMNQHVKIVLYAVLAICTLWFGYSFFSSLTRASAPRQSQVQQEDDAPPATNAAVTAVSTNTAGDTNAVANAASETNGVAVTNAPVKQAAIPAKAARAKVNWGSFGLMLIGVLGLAVIGAYDFSRLVANKVDDLVFNDNLEGVKDPEYEEAEKVWTNGQHLEAVQLMRDYLKRNPREVHVALRIAEIYEKDLGNYLAAALEYEEVLKKKLPPDRWGWAAIHLSNLYSGRLNKSKEAMALLNRIVNEYGQTPAAKKARERLGIPEPVEEAAPAPVAEPESVKVDEPPKSNLPPGFRPK